MNILKTTTNDKKTVYQLTKSAALQRIQDNEGKDIEVKNFVLYEDVKNSGEIATVLSIEDASGEMYATNSPTFREAFLDIASICGDDPADMIGEKVRITSGTSKAGRKFFTCVWA